MKQLLFISILALVLLISSCKPKGAWEKKSIEEKENLLMAEARKGKTDTAAINQLLAAYEGFADANKGDTNGANYLFKEAEFYSYMHKPQRSIEVYKKIYDNYPTFEKRPQALFLQGFTYENEMGKIDSARVKYEQFVAAYPDNALTKDVKISILNLGKTPEQLISEFEQNAKADSLAESNSK
jgi:tetratricopeptide (TPR) repeat protein